jgi:hypothetical protein
MLLLIIFILVKMLLPGFLIHNHPVGSLFALPLPFISLLF